MTLNKLTLNCSKTEVIAITTATTRDPWPIIVHVDTEVLRPKPYVRDIGIVLDDAMNMAWHVSHTCRLAYHHLRSIAKVRNSLTMIACKTMILSLVPTIFRSRFTHRTSIPSGALRPPLFHRCRPSSVERTVDPSERIPIIPVLQGHTKNSRVVPVTFEHFKLFYLLVSITISLCILISIYVLLCYFMSFDSCN